MNQSKLKPVILWVIKIGLFIVPFIPLYVSKMLFFPYITGKAFIFRIIIEVIFAAWLFLVLFYKEYRPKLSPIIWAVTIFVAIVALATIAGINPVKSFWSNFERMEGLVTYLHLFAYLLVISHVFQKKDWFIFFNLFVISGILENIYVVFQQTGYFPSPQGGARSDGTIGNPTYLAAYLMFILGFSIFLLLNTKIKWAKYFYGFSVLFTLWAIYSTASRGPALALLAGLVIWAIAYLVLKKPADIKERFSKKLILGALGIIFMIPVAFWFARDTDFIKNNPSLSRLTSLSLKERTVSSRFTIWNMSFQGFQEHPLLGWGPENYSVVFSKYYRPELWRQEPWFDRSHNIVFDWLINAGLLGLGAYLGIFAAAFYAVSKLYLQRQFSVEAVILLPVILIAYFLQNLFVFDNLATYVSFFGILGFLHSMAYANDVPDTISKISVEKKPRESDALMIAGALVIPLMLIIYFFNLKPLRANLDLLRALAIQGQNPQESFGYFERALSRNTFGNPEIREHFTRFAIGVGGLQQLDAGFRDTVLRRAISEVQKSILEEPLDPRPRLFLGTIYSNVGLFDEALLAFNEASALSPNKQQIYFEIADVYLKKNDYPKAVEIMEKAYNLDTSFNSGAFNLAATYILNNQQDKADALLMNFYGTVDVADTILVQVYSRTQNYPRLVGVWQAFVKNDPNNLPYRTSLAGAYLLADQKSEAIKVIQEAISLNPQFQSEGEAYIREILK